MIGNISDPQGGDFTNTHPAKDRKNECEPVSVRMSSRFDDPKHTSNVVIREHRCLGHGGSFMRKCRPNKYNISILRSTYRFSWFGR